MLHDAGLLHSRVGSDAHALELDLIGAAKYVRVAHYCNQDAIISQEKNVERGDTSIA